MILVIGANGQLGRAFRRILPPELSIFIDQTELDLAKASSDEIIASILDLKPDVVINCAAFTNVDGAESNPELANKINADAVVAMAIACDELGIPFVTYSTDYVYDGRPPLGGWREDDFTNPLNAYGRSKRAGEEGALKFPNTIVIRTSWLIGKGPNFVRAMLQLAKTRDEVTVVCDQVGRLTFADDLALATKKLLDLRSLLINPTDMPQIIHISNSGTPMSWAEIAKLVFRFAGLPTRVIGVSTNEYVADLGDRVIAPRPSNSVFCLERLNELGIYLPNANQSLRSYVQAQKK